MGDLNESLYTTSPVSWFLTSSFPLDHPTQISFRPSPVRSNALNAVTLFLLLILHLRFRPSYTPTVPFSSAYPNLEPER